MFNFNKKINVNFYSGSLLILDDFYINLKNKTMLRYKYFYDKTIIRFILSKESIVKKRLF